MASDRVERGVALVTQEELAEFLGVRRTTITGLVVKLKRLCLVYSQRGRFTVVDQCGLEKHACPCYSVCRDALSQLYTHKRH